MSEINHRSLSIALSYGWPDVHWILAGDSLAGLIWHETTPRPSDEEIIAMIPKALEIERKKKRIAELEEEFALLDAKSIRALRTNDAKRLAEIEAKVEALRQEYRELVKDLPLRG